MVMMIPKNMLMTVAPHPGSVDVFCQIFVGRFGVSFSPFERLFLGRFGFGQSCGLSVIA
ncbi:Transcriptional regulator, LysR family [Bifidobacterium breve]|nr:Transcriptional regulator, LysR family [Bifidobacterium breve]